MNRTTALAAATVFVSGGLASADVVYDDYTSFLNDVDVFMVEDFEGMPDGHVFSDLAFGTLGAYSVTSTGASENRIEAHHDGHGAINFDGDNFWKLRGGTTVIDFDHDYDAFGFHYSDLESNHISVILRGAEDYVFPLAGRNSMQTDWFGATLDGGATFNQVVFQWGRRSNGDGLGIDTMTVGNAAVIPSPGAPMMACLGGLLFVRRRR